MQGETNEEQMRRVLTAIRSIALSAAETCEPRWSSGTFERLANLVTHTLTECDNRNRKDERRNE